MTQKSHLLELLSALSCLFFMSLRDDEFFHYFHHKESDFNFSKRISFDIMKPDDRNDGFLKVHKLSFVCFQACMMSGDIVNRLTHKLYRKQTHFSSLYEQMLTWKRNGKNFVKLAMNWRQEAVASCDAINNYILLNYIKHTRRSQRRKQFFVVNVTSSRSAKTKGRQYDNSDVITIRCCHSNADEVTTTSTFGKTMLYFFCHFAYPHRILNLFLFLMGVLSMVKLLYVTFTKKFMKIWSRYLKILNKSECYFALSREIEEEIIKNQQISEKTKCATSSEGHIFFKRCCLKVVRN